MAIQLAIALLPLLLLFTLIHTVQSTDFDVVKNFGAKSDGKTDLSTPLLNAWKEACGSAEASGVVIPKGKYTLSGTTLEGPCKAPISLKVEGTIMAPQSPGAFKNGNWVLIQRVEALTMSGGGVFDGQGSGCWGKNEIGDLPINLRFFAVNNSLVEDITSKDSKQFHVNVLSCHNITFRKFSSIAPGDSANTDGLHIGRSDGVHILDSKFQTGDDCVSIGDGSLNVHIKGITCGPGHGISIGSLGKYKNEDPVNGIFVKKCTLTNTVMSGVRIKTWPALYPGTATDMHFEDITMKNVTDPIIIDQEYCPWNKCNKKVPSRVKLSKISFKNIRGTSASHVAVKLICSSGLPCEDVKLADIDLTYSGPEGKAISLCSNVSPKLSGTQNPPACSSKPKEGSSEPKEGSSEPKESSSEPKEKSSKPKEKSSKSKEKSSKPKKDKEDDD